MKEDNKKSNTFRVLWNSLMFLIYLAIAYLIMFTPKLLPYNYRANDPDTDDFVVPRMILGVGVAIYALFRGYRLLNNKK